MKREDMTPADVTSLCDAATEAWDKIGNRATTARFKWRGQTYVAKSSQFRLMVDDAKGNPIACRYY